MDTAQKQLAELRRRQSEESDRLERLRAERAELALTAESGDAAAVKRRAVLRREIAEAEVRLAEVREAIPPAQAAARREANAMAESRRQAALSVAYDALGTFDAAAAELAPMIDDVARRMAVLDHRANAALAGLRGILSVDQIHALAGHPAAVHVLARLVQLGALSRDCLPAEYDSDIKLAVPPCDQALRAWSDRVRAWLRPLMRPEGQRPDLREAA